MPGLPGAPGATGATGPQGPAGGGTIISGYINANGTTNGGSGFTSSMPLAGIYIVTLTSLPNGTQFFPVVSALGTNVFSRISGISAPDPDTTPSFTVEMRPLTALTTRTTSEFTFIVVPKP